eukprot:9718017-Lingulodinium_polyedra.AAC.1
MSSPRHLCHNRPCTDSPPTAAPWLPKQPASEPSGHALDWQTFSITKMTIRAEANQGGMPTRALTIARADMCLASAPLKSDT